ncbi:probable pre-mRNA-splicing factor cwc26 [Rhynchosporium agropyri]|uniref:Probable pre-mRNA-splicing factor cwc26 n=1 Tax=Rhynchosporium agropyri TaxID=914238 RepID=A0A1E1KFD8_9HELO|nr:probable pre-mRNA-splicing factor cwc26 [Rhynchosporium agropyri]
MSLSSYLASKYLTADTSSTTSSGKKRKRKTPKENNGLIIADDDALGWTASATTNGEDDTPLTISSGSAEFRKAKKNAWKTVGAPALQPRDADSEAADRIVAEAAKENSAAMHDDEGPVIENGGEDDGVIKMGDGTHAGLQSAKAVAAQFEKRKREEAKAWEREQAALGLGAGKGGKRKEEETVYRDATGRRIDISMRRQEARREADAKAAKEREELEAQKGDVQRAAKEKRREDLDEARFLTVARGVDDIEMNEGLKEVERWNDPAAQFLSKKPGGVGKSGKWRKQVYTGAAAPNRYGIRPGYKWDGVDRGNGWEGERFKAQNRTARNKELDYAWQEDT